MGMKIENKLSDKKVAFKTIRVGAFFLDEDGDLCVRINSDCCMLHDIYCFSCGLLLDKDDDDLVTPVDVTITIDGYAS